MNQTPDQLWQALLGELQVTLQPSVFDSWFKDTSVVAFEEGTLVVACKSAFAKDWLEKRMKAVIRRPVERLFGRSVELHFVVRAAAPVQSETPPPLFDQSDHSDNGNDARRPAAPAVNLPVSLQRNMTFETFIEGEGNRFASAAAHAVAEDPGSRYNPLVLYGGVGLGKTHLLHAIGNATATKGYQVRYVTSETFTNDLIEAIRSKANSAFRQTYREVDVLLIDDIQFIENKDATQTEFFHTFNYLYAANKQIVIASDRPPGAITHLEERLRSRFDGGLTADLQPPDLEHRIAILRAKAGERGMVVPETVLRYIAERYSNNVRELQGALNQVVAYGQTHSVPITPEVAHRVLSADNGRLNDSPEAIAQAVADEFRLSLSELKGPKRSHRIVVARQVAMYFMREVSQLSFPQIGDYFGGRDHTTAIYGIGKINERINQDTELRSHVERVRVRLRR